MAFRSSSNEAIANIDIDSEQNYYRSDAHEGHFIGLVKLMADDNMALKNYLKETKKYAENGHRNSLSLLSNNFIKNTLLAVREYLGKVFVKEITRNGGCFSIMMDGSQDISCKEQVSLVVRYVNDVKEIVERTVAFFNARSTRSMAL